MTTPTGRAAPEVVTFGETMAALRAHGALRLGGSLGLSVAGAESNVAIGLARLGHRVHWAGQVGADELGALVLRTLRAEGVDAGRPTGLLLAEPRLGTLTRVSYYRAASAGSAVSPAGEGTFGLCRAGPGGTTRAATPSATAPTTPTRCRPPVTYPTPARHRAVRPVPPCCAARCGGRRAGCRRRCP